MKSSSSNTLGVVTRLREDTQSWWEGLGWVREVERDTMGSTFCWVNENIGGGSWREPGNGKLKTNCCYMSCTSVTSAPSYLDWLNCKRSFVSPAASLYLIRRVTEREKGAHHIFFEGIVMVWQDRRSVVVSRKIPRNYALNYYYFYFFTRNLHLENFHISRNS